MSKQTGKGTKSRSRTFGEPTSTSRTSHNQCQGPGTAASHHQRLVCRDHAGVWRRTSEFTWLSKPRCLQVGMSKFYSLRFTGRERRLQPKNSRTRKPNDLARPIGNAQQAVGEGRKKILLCYSCARTLRPSTTANDLPQRGQQEDQVQNHFQDYKSFGCSCPRHRLAGPKPTGTSSS